MPYIAAEDRPQYEELIKSLAGTIREATGDHTKHDHHKRNYVVTRLLLDASASELRYWQHNEIIGMLECCKQEFYRRQTGPYENTCIEKSGDI